MIRTAIQLQTLEGLPETLPETIERVGETPLDGVEFFGLDGTPPEDVAEALDETGLEAVGAHVSIDRLEHEYEDVLETYETIGCRRLIVPLIDADAFRSAEGVVETARRLSALGERAADDGFDLLYHNHAFEFTRLANENETAYDSLVNDADGVDFELDTGLALYAGADPLTLLSRHEGRIPMVHLTDSVPGNETTIQVELTAGELDVKDCVDTARDSGVEWLVYEHGQTSDVLGSLAHAATVLPTLSSGRDEVATAPSKPTAVDGGDSIPKDVF